MKKVNIIGLLILSSLFATSFCSQYSKSAKRLVKICLQNSNIKKDDKKKVTMSRRSQAIQKLAAAIIAKQKREMFARPVILRAKL
jgi:hypothetical protein